MTRRRILLVASLALAVFYLGGSMAPSHACSTPLQLVSAAASGNSIHSEISNSSPTPASGYLTLHFVVGGTTYSYSISVTLPPHSVVEVTVTFNDTPVLLGAEVCTFPGGTTESPDPVVQVKVERR